MSPALDPDDRRLGYLLVGETEIHLRRVARALAVGMPAARRMLGEAGWQLSRRLVHRTCVAEYFAPVPAGGGH